MTETLLRGGVSHRDERLRIIFLFYLFEDVSPFVMLIYISERKSKRINELYKVIHVSSFPCPMIRFLPVLSHQEILFPRNSFTKDSTLDDLKIQLKDDWSSLRMTVQSSLNFRSVVPCRYSPLIVLYLRRGNLYEYKLKIFCAEPES